MSLRGKQKLFALAYVGEAKFNATKAAEIAGYCTSSRRTLTSIGHENLTKPDIKEFIKNLTERRFKDEGYTNDRVIKEIIDIAFADVTDFMDKKGNIKINRDIQPTAAIKEIKRSIIGSKQFDTLEIKFHDKKWALEMLSKLLDMKSGESNEVIINLLINSESRS